MSGDGNQSSTTPNNTCNYARARLPLMAPFLYRPDLSLYKCREDLTSELERAGSCTSHQTPI